MTQAGTEASSMFEKDLGNMNESVPVSQTLNTREGTPVIVETLF